MTKYPTQLDPEGRIQQAPWSSATVIFHLDNGHEIQIVHSGDHLEAVVLEKGAGLKVVPVSSKKLSLYNQDRLETGPTGKRPLPARLLKWFRLG